jgi:hypothetical protein
MHARRGSPLPEIMRDRRLRLHNRQWTYQLLEKHGLLALWRDAYAQRRAHARTQAVIARWGKSVTGRALLKFMRGAKSRGWPVTFSSTLDSVLIDGRVKVRVHAPQNTVEIAGHRYYVARSRDPDALHAVLLPRTNRFVFYLPGALELREYVRAEFDRPEAQFDWPTLAAVVGEAKQSA